MVTMMLNSNNHKIINKVVKFLFYLLIFFFIIVGQIPKPDIPATKDEQKGILSHIVKFS